MEGTHNHTTGEAAADGEAVGRAPLPPTATETVARSRLQALLDGDAYERNYRALLDSVRPQDPFTHALIQDLARQIVSGQRWDLGLEASMRHAADTLAAFSVGGAAVSDVALIAGVMNAESVVRCERNAAARSRSLRKTMAQLLELQSRRDRAPARERVLVFPTEADCEAHLLQEFLKHPQCARCGDERGCYLPSRKRWECTACRVQTGLRSGTVMAGSRLALKNLVRRHPLSAGAADRPRRRVWPADRRPPTDDRTPVGSADSRGDGRRRCNSAARRFRRRPGPTAPETSERSDAGM